MIKNMFNKAWTFFKGKKRWIALGATLVARVVPSHTAVGQGASFLKDNIEYVGIGFDVIAGLFGGAAIVEVATKKVKEVLPSGIRKKEEGS